MTAWKYGDISGPSDQKLLRSLLVTAATRYLRSREQAHEGAYGIETVAGHFSPFQPDQLDKLLRDQPLFTQGRDLRRGILLEPVDRNPEVWPILFLNLDFRQPVPRLQLAVMLCSFVGGIPEAIALRFESPEGADAKGVGEHNYYHAQFTRQLRVGVSLISLSPAKPPSTCPHCGQELPLENPWHWLSETQPAFALDARSPVTLAACVFISLYGAAFFRREYATQVDGLSQHLNHMLCISQHNYPRLVKSAEQAHDADGRWLIHPGSER